MARIQETVEIKRPVDKVFVYVTDGNKWPQWHSAMLEAEQESSGQMGVGTTFRGANRVMGRRMEWTSKVTECEMNKKWGEFITSGSTQIKEHLTFDPIENGTKFTLVYEMSVGGLLKLLSPMVVSAMRNETKENLRKLKSILEAQT